MAMDLPAFFVVGAKAMGLMEKIRDDMKIAMKSGDKLRLETLRTLRAVLMEKEIERRGSEPGMTPEDESAVLATAAKRRKESIEQFQKGGRNDLADQEMKELAIIQEYMPKQLSADEVATVVKAAIADVAATSAADFGKVMPIVMKQVKGKADGKMVQDIVRKLLGA
jgi:hypothetical protein